MMLEDSLGIIWARALRVSPAVLLPQRTFFEQGGYSLLAVQVAQQIVDELGIDCELTALLQYDTLLKLAEYLRARPRLDWVQPQGEAREPSVDAGLSAQTIEPFSLTPLQEAYWIGEQGVYELDSSATWYAEYVAPEVDVERLARALNAVVARHPMLRAVFTEDAYQRVLPDPGPFPLTFEDLRALEPEAARERLRFWQRQLAGQPRSLLSWPQFNVCVLRQLEETRVLLAGRLIILDGLSGEIFARDLNEAYLGDGQLGPSPRVTFSGYLHSLRERSTADAGGQRAAAVQYWWSRLDALPPAPSLPLRKLAPGSEAPMVRFASRLSAADWVAFRGHARALGVTPTVAVASTFAQILAHWGGGQHFTLNVMYGNRRLLHPDVLQVIGNFSDTLLLEVALRGASMAEAAQDLQQQLFRDLQAADVSGVEVIRELARRRGSGSSDPLMPVVFASGLGMEEATDDAQSAFFMEKLGWSLLDASIQTPQVLLDHQIVENRGELMVQWDARCALFPEGMVEAMFEAYSALLTRLARAGAAAWGEPPRIELVRQLEVRRRVNSVARHFAAGLLQDGFLAQAERFPDVIAVLQGERAWSYGALREWAFDLACQIRAWEPTGAEPIAVVVPRGPEQIAAVLAILMAGCAYVPITPNTPAERVRVIAEQCKLRFALCARECGEARAALLNKDVRLLGTARADNQHVGSSTPSLRRINPNALAYVIFTSGTTGVPKGVAISHAAALNTILDINQRFDVTSADRVLALSELNFDLSVYDIFGLLGVGATLVVPEPELAKNPIHLAQLVQRHRVTLWNSVPAFMDMVSELAASKAPAALASLRVVMLSGDWIPVTLPERIRSLAPTTRIIALGGATEASIWSNFFELDEVDPEWTTIPYGYPLSNQSFHVLDEAMNDRPDWVAGELFIGGQGLALGYFGSANATIERFVTRPQDGSRLYRTGDWGCYWPNGALEFLGRRDTQVKIRGHRIELGDIDAALLRHPLVREAAVVAVGPRPSERALLGYFVASSGQALSPADLKAHLAAELPDYMVPPRLLQIEALPLTVNGKVDRRRLESALRDEAPAALPIPELATELEQTLARIWRTLLALPSIGAETPFVEAGGNSISAVRLVQRISDELGVELPLSIACASPTIRSLACEIARQTPGEFKALIAIREDGHEPPLFCVHPVGGNVFCYWELARWYDGPLLALQARGTRRGWAPHLSVEAMAEHYVREIVERQPEGPIRLLGWSMGGMIALELARLLEQRGRRAAVVLLDTLVRREARFLPTERALLAAFFSDLGRGVALPFDQLLAGLVREEALRVGQDALVRAGVLAGALDPSMVQVLFDVFAANSLAIHRFNPPTLSARALLLESTVSSSERFPALQPLYAEPDWRRALPQLKRKSIDGDHFSVIAQDAMPGLTAELKAFFADSGPGAAARPNG
ncbi:MAG: hypothetical protein RJA70_2238 [Pseudomonadota bacterium]|jgi:amino acid adenylation domain-containing protein